MHGSPLVEIKNACISGLSFEKLMEAQRMNARALTCVPPAASIPDDLQAIDVS